MSLSIVASTRSRIVCAVVALSAVCVARAARAQAAAPPTKGECIDANEAAQRLRMSGELHAAKERLLLCVNTSCPGPVQADCMQRLTELKAAMPTIVFEAKDESDQDIADVHVSMDGKPFASVLDGTAIAVDPGEHTFVFEATGRQKIEKALVVSEGAKDRHEAVVLLSAEPPPAPAPLSPIAPAPTPAAPVDEGSSPSDGNVERSVGLGLAGIGAVVMVAGAVFGILAKVTYDQALSSECAVSNPSACSQSGYDDGQSAHTEATVATIGFVAGGALLAGGLVLYVTAPKDNSLSIAPTLGSRSAGLHLSGRF
ncbi:MAG: hypothetical protein ACREJ3_07950 [Polyangiaceae bacterium]